MGRFLLLVHVALFLTRTDSKYPLEMKTRERTQPSMHSAPLPSDKSSTASQHAHTTKFEVTQKSKTTKVNGTVKEDLHLGDHFSEALFNDAHLSSTTQAQNQYADMNVEQQCLYWLKEWCFGLT